MSAPGAPPAPDHRGGAPWRRLSPRVLWVDLLVGVPSVLPGLVAVRVTSVETLISTLWPLAALAVMGLVGALSDVTRWAFTRYRITDTEVELRTGVLVRARRTVQRDRIRSVDTHAKLRHRLTDLRVVTIGAGQQTSAGEAAFVLDALSTADAARLRRELLDTAAATQGSRGGLADVRPTPRVRVLATLRRRWVFYSMLNPWGLALAVGGVWGVAGFADSAGIDVLEAVRTLDWAALDWWSIGPIALLAGWVVGAIGLAAVFFASYWEFELARLRVAGRSYLRTRRGLFSTREVSRDEARLRGLSLGEPLWGRWLGVADTNVITTGLSVSDSEQPTAILPRAPLGVARRVARDVLGEPCPLEVALPRHPRAALRRRLLRACLWAGAPTLFVLVPVVAGEAPAWVVVVAFALWPAALLGALVAYRALGHAIAGEYVVVRSGLGSRVTSALRRDAVSTIAVRQSLLQKRLGLATVSAMSAAGVGAYEAPDLAAHEAVSFALEAASGLLEEFVVGVR